MQRNIFYLYIVWFLILVIVVVVAVIYSLGNKKYQKTSIAIPSPPVTINNDRPLKKMQIKGFDRIVVAGTVDSLSLDPDTGQYTLSMLLNASNQILVELGSPQYHHLVRYGAPKGEKNTIEEILTMEGLVPILTKGKKVEIEVSLNPEIEGFLNTFNSKQDKIFRIILPTVISIKV